MLETAPDGVEIVNSAMVKVEKDVDPELIIERLFHAFLNQHYRLRGQFLPHQKVLRHKVHILVCERCNVHIPVGQHNLMLYVILSVLSRPQRKILIDHKD